MKKLRKVMNGMAGIAGVVRGRPVVGMRKRRADTPPVTDTPVELMAGPSRGNSGGRRQGGGEGEDQPGVSRPKRRCVIRAAEQRRLNKGQASTPSGRSTHCRPKGMSSCGGRNEAAEAEAVENDVNELLCVFGDCDPDHIRTKLLLLAQMPNRAEALHRELLSGGYPTLGERLRRQDAERRTAELLLTPNTERIINRYEDSDGRLRQARKRKSEGSRAYKDQAVSFIANRCLHLPLPYIGKVVTKHNDIISAHEQLSIENAKRQEAPRAKGRRGTYLVKPRTTPVSAPPALSHDFIWDSLYIEKQSEIQDYKERQEASKTLRYMVAKSAGTLKECPVCLDNLPPEDMLTCPHRHLFCRTCISLAVRVQAAQGQNHFPCLLHDCEHQFDLHILLQALPESLYRTVEGRVAQEEVRQAGIPGAVSCPHCFYTVVYPDDQRSSVLQCENPDCFKTSCRFCKGEAHVPFTCEQRANAKARLQQHIEHTMTEAVVRTCWSCKNRFVKVGGCNRMACPNCKAVMCYVCGDKLENGYGHFDQNKGNLRCRILDEKLIHETDLETVLRTAEKDFKKSNREADGISLGYDPLEDWKAAPVAVTPPWPQWGMLR